MAQPQDAPVNDRTEGILRDPVLWKGAEIVSYVKDIGSGDPGYDASIKQVLIMKQDGTQEVVPESEISREKKVLPPATAMEPARVPEATLPPVAPGPDNPNPQARAAPEQADDDEEEVEESPGVKTRRKRRR